MAVVFCASWFSSGPPQGKFFFLLFAPELIHADGRIDVTFILRSARLDRADDDT